MRGDRDPDRVQSLTTDQHSTRIKWAQLRRTVGLITLLSFALCSLTPLANVIGKFTVVPATIGTAYSIVVLGAGILDDGSLASRDGVLVERGRRVIPVNRTQIFEAEGISAAGAVPQSRLSHVRTSTTRPAGAVTTSDCNLHGRPMIAPVPRLRDL